MAKVVLDASAVLVLLQSEPGHEIVRDALRHAACYLTAANLAEVAGKLRAILQEASSVRRLLALPGLEVLPVDEELAYAAAELLGPGRALGLSLGDRLCLAAGQRIEAEVLTADAIWSQLRVPGLQVRQLRPSPSPSIASPSAEIP